VTLAEQPVIVFVMQSWGKLVIAWGRGRVFSNKMAPMLAIGVAILSISLFALIFGKHMQLNSKRSEARIMLAYLHTLQRGFFLEEGRYKYFSDFYGAPLGGQSQCSRPPGARELGFMLRACERGLTKNELRYAYAVYPKESDEGKAYLAVAISGSDSDGTSKVCARSTQVDKWTIDDQRNIEHSVACAALADNILESPLMAQ